jgi:hypothetical protein
MSGCMDTGGMDRVIKRRQTSGRPSDGDTAISERLQHGGDDRVSSWPWSSR